MNEVDFSYCRRIPGRAYNGANGKKIAVEWRGDCWILKFPPSAAERPNDLSYSNSCYSEHIASSIFRMLGIAAQETALGTFTNGKTHVVCACRSSLSALPAASGRSSASPPASGSRSRKVSVK